MAFRPIRDMPRPDGLPIRPTNVSRETLINFTLPLGGSDAQRPHEGIPRCHNVSRETWHRLPTREAGDPRRCYTNFWSTRLWGRLATCRSHQRRVAKRGIRRRATQLFSSTKPRGVGAATRQFPWPPIWKAGDPQTCYTNSVRQCQPPPCVPAASNRLSARATARGVSHHHRLSAGWTSCFGKVGPVCSVTLPR